MAIKNRLLQRSKNHSPVFTRRLLPLLVGTAISINQAQAVEFNLGEIEGRFDSQISVGASWRAKDASSGLVSRGNGGISAGSGSYDDGNQNFKQGETFSQIVKGVHDLELSYENMGVFTRAKYWYDAELESGSRAHGHSANNYTPGAELDDSGFNDYAKFSGFELLDAYWYGGFDLGEKPLDVRIGRQVVNWGESTFIQGGLNTINPFDVNAFRRAGAEVKEGLLPVNMAFASLGVTDNLSVEGFYQIKWEPTAVDGCGTYFSNNDFGAEGCDGIRVQTTDPTLSALLGINVSDQTYFNSLSGSAPWVLAGIDPVVNRHEDGRREADDDGQFGLSLRYFAEDLNATEFGFYLAKYHSRFPISSGIKSNTSPADIAASLARTYGINTPTAAAVVAAFDSEYFVEYPEDIKMIGLSFNTNVGDVAWSGEISHKKDAPVQINGPLLVGAILRQNVPGGIGNTAADNLIASTAAGGEISGYTPFDITQVQTSFIKFYDQVLGASRLALIGEAAWTHVHGLDEGANALKYGRNGAYGYASGDTEGFVTQDSYGYVLRANLNYPNAFAGVNLTPQISFKHGLEGYGPQPGAAFNEDEKTLGLSLTADYLNKYRVQLSYTDYFGGKFNSIEDRDFISLSASVSF
ncbi:MULTISPECIES: DUF1302 domain-containing protein [unclassified Marinobacterium]|uniref:DUF1302 domain-containing protein n=1 Tax=unclassified Marinobacterium TaxID=2644139 RepID=UPI00156A68FB|nr:MULTISPECIES: DUF1302 domain-containing protein [unclassified Marinobacterium]NRP09418.1 hypothetical protein [Marinobacterium sp. xm-g-48]NRP82051.1 hypothetical protein [Marinobacterium sp. xm-d-509]